ncbi:MAG TPA: reverse transcriptase domain-containing protein, partial [Puia sp.]
KLSMEDLGFQCLNSDAGVFLYRKKDAFCIAVVYVDDSFFTGPDVELNQLLKEAFMKKWECRDLGELTEFLGMKIVRDGSKIHLDQCAYLKVVLERWHGKCQTSSYSSPGWVCAD